ncbi:MAG: AAA family ATPase [Thermoplasmata archaeon]|nr:AAA family ATPase [Thermoplasmata archaeon]
MMAENNPPGAPADEPMVPMDPMDPTLEPLPPPPPPPPPPTRAPVAARTKGAPGPVRPPTGGRPAPPRPGATGKPRRPGQRTYLTFAVIALVFIGVGAGLAVTWYPLVVHSTDAATFLVQADATLTTDQGTNYVYFGSSYYHAGQTVVVQDTVKSATYNATSGTTSLSFASIQNNGALAPVLGPIAADLFGTLQGKVSWIGSNTPVVLSFTVVSVQLPGGPSGSGTYLTLDAAADASYRALSQGLSGPQGAAIAPQYVQGYPALQYDGLFYFLIGVGVVLFAIGRLYAAKIEAWLLKETKEPKTLPVLFIGFLGVLGGSFVPFYPWPFVLLIAGAVMLVAWKYPQLSLLILVLFITPAVAYQSGALGLVFLFATIPILFASLLDWRFGAGVFLTLLLAPFGLSFVGPVFFAVVFSLYLGLAVAVAGGLLVSLFVTLGNFPVFGYLTGPGGNGTVSLVSGHSAPLLPTLPLPFFTANAIGSAYASVLNPNLSQLANGGGGLGALPIPLAEIGVWCLAIWLITSIMKDRAHLTTDKVLRTSTYSGALVAGGTVGGLIAFGYLGWESIAVVLLVPAMITTVVASLILRDAFEAYFTSRLGGTNVGTRVADMKGLSKVTFDMVGGLHDVKADIKESMIVPLLRRDVTTRFKLDPPKGILLFGPPGCGKTMLMKALATELGVEMISIKCSDVMSKWYGESEGKIAELLRTARERAPCILFMDEIDAIAKRRDMYSADDVTPRLLSILLAEMDGIDKSAGVIVVGSTNKPDLIDQAMLRPGRLDKIIYVPPPDFQERTEILHVHLVGRPVKGDIDLAEIARKTERFSGADLANLVREATTVAVRRQMTSGARAAISMDDFRAVTPRMKPSISLRMIADYDTMKLDYERKMHQTQRTERKIVVRWDDVGGLEDIKSAIREYVELPLTRPELMESYRIKTGRGILLFGPPGCGKTHLMRAAANELNVPMQIVSGPELVSALAGQSEAAIREVLYRGRENAPSIIFFDEIDALASKDSMRTPEVSRAVSQFLTEMDGLRPKDKVIIIATTNRPQTLDPALLRPGRFDKIFYVPPPDLDARRDIFKIHMKGTPVEGPIDFDLLAEKSAGFSGADIAGLVDEAKLIALRTQLLTELPGMIHAAPGSAAAVAQAVDVKGVMMANLIEALGRTKSSITVETLTWAQEFIRTYGTRG